jgi:molybdopterin synthase catalytic subunit
VVDAVNLSALVQYEDFDPAAEYGRLRQRASGMLGAVVTFTGLVRDRHDGEEVATLHLEHYPGMTERSIEDIARKAAERWPLDDIVIIHRVGALAAAEQIVFVQVASSHRDAAFAGAAFIMDYLKTDAVFWKREDKSSGSRWVESTGSDQARRRSWESGNG